MPGASWVLICRINIVLICDELSSLRGMQTCRYPSAAASQRSAAPCMRSSSLHRAHVRSKHIMFARSTSGQTFFLSFFFIWVERSGAWFPCPCRCWLGGRVWVILIGDDKTGSSDGLRCFNFCGRVDSRASCAVLCFTESRRQRLSVPPFSVGTGNCVIMQTFGASVSYSIPCHDHASGCH